MTASGAAAAWIPDARDGTTLDRAWAIPVLLAAVTAGATARTAPAAVVGLIAVALVPWVLGMLGRPLPGWLFGALGVLPVAGVVVLEDLDASVFLGTTTLCHLASRAGRPLHLVALTAIGCLLPFVAVSAGHPFDPGAIYFAIGDLFAIVVGLLLARTRRLGTDLRAADARLAALAAQEERTRLARDVHDLVAHSLTVVVLQVGGARRVLRADPGVAEAALEQAERVCRESLDGMREVVGLLRTDGEAPAASLDLVPLVETYRSAAVDVDLQVDGDPEGLPLLVRGTLHRVVQEALANAARYRTAGSTVRVRVRIDADRVTAGITNPGVGRRSGPGGYGLAGLREQVSAVGGTLSSGPDADGWAVECRLPRRAATSRPDAVVA